MSNFTATGMFVPIAFALSAMKAPVTLIESSRRFQHRASWTYQVRYCVDEKVSSAELTVGVAQLEAVYDPGEFVSSIIVALLHNVKFPDKALSEARSVAEFVQDGGAFGAEVFGGFHDGASFPDLPLDRDLFPPPKIAVPLPRPWVVSAVGGDTDEDLGSVTYVRDRLDPDRRKWLYRL